MGLKFDIGMKINDYLKLEVAINQAAKRIDNCLTSKRMIDNFEIRH